MAEWVHYVGERYSPASFIREAEEHGVSRRIPMSQAKACKYGDVVMLMQWNTGKPLAFAEFVISSISLQGNAATQVAQDLINEGRATPSGGDPVTIKRECGEYTAMPAVRVWNTSIAEICDRAEAVSKSTGEKVWVMIAGNITRVFRPEQGVYGYSFFRGLKKARGLELVRTERSRRVDPTITRVRGYQAR